MEQSIKETFVRYIVLLLLGIALTANYFGMNFPSPTSLDAKDHFNINEVEFEIFAIGHTIVCVFTSFFAGVLCDLIGVRRCYLIFTLITVFGQLMCLFGLYVEFDQFLIGMLGRLILGIGAEA